jgi:hypothetical protein
MPQWTRGTDSSERLSVSEGGPGRERRDPSGPLGDLRRVQPADATTKNLLALLTAKLEICAGLPVWEWEAVNEGHERCAATLHDLADTERRSCTRVMECLRIHLERQTETSG